MVRRIGWGRSRGQLGCWGDSGSVPLIPLPPPPLPPLCRGPGAGRVSIFSLSSAPHVRNTSSSLPTQSLGSPCPAVQAPGVSQPPSSVPPTPATPPGQGRLVMSPISAAPSWGSHPVPPLALVTSPPSRQYPQDPPGLRIGPLIPEQDYERLGDCDPEGSQESPIHGEEQPLLHVPEGLRGECWGADDPRGLSLATAKSPPSPLSPLLRLLAPHPEPGYLLHQDILCVSEAMWGFWGSKGSREGLPVTLFLNDLTSTATTRGTALSASC